LSSVPPVWPRPRPLIIGTATPHARDHRREVQRHLVADAAVECLSTLGNFTDARSATTPEPIIASVSAAVSAVFIPRRNIAMSIAAELVVGP